jgi:hypothetical protein
MINALIRWHDGIAAGLAVLLMATSCAAKDRKEDVIYPADWKLPPLHLKVLVRTPLTATRDPHSMIDYLTEGQTVEVIGLGETRDFVKTRVATGSAQGWVDAGALEMPPAELVARLKDRREKAEAHRQLVERHEVVAGMTPAEVHASLGKPDRISRIRVRTGDEEQWYYITYRHVPRYMLHYDSNGQPQRVVTYRREQSGQRIITFRKDEAVEIVDEPTDPTPSPPAAVGP